MRRADPKIRAAFAIATLAGLGAAWADVVELRDVDYYRVILDRNAFGLRELPQTTPEPTNAPPAVKVDVKFTGITAHSGAKKAWFMIPPQAGKSKDPKYLSMAEGDKDGDLQVLEIDEKLATVKVLNAGATVVLNFREHGLAAPTALAVPSPTGAGVPGIVRPPGVNPAVPQPVSAYAPAAPGMSPAPMAQASMETPVNTTTRTIPSRNLRTTPIPVEAAAQPVIDPAVQYIQLKAQEHAAKMQGLQPPPIPGLGNE